MQRPRCSKGRGTASAAYPSIPRAKQLRQAQLSSGAIIARRVGISHLSSGSRSPVRAGILHVRKMAVLPSPSCCHSLPGPPLPCSLASFVVVWALLPCMPSAVSPHGSLYLALMCCSKHPQTGTHGQTDIPCSAQAIPPGWDACSLPSAMSASYGRVARRREFPSLSWRPATHDSS